VPPPAAFYAAAAGNKTYTSDLESGC
jgi:hypothetical protein